ncbi:MAG: hypothetical protein SVK08_01375 [Halobacteriota archaeon]|nr:hypothetical protein [Halobacteriota archaeon]
MDKVMYYNVAGVGNLFALELGQYAENTQIAWPALGFNVPHPTQEGQIVLQLTNFVPEFLSDYSETNKNLSIPNNLIIIRSSVSAHLEKVYLEWQRKTQTKATGIMVPDMKPGKILQ